MVITTIITFVIIFSLLIFLHELGHFLTARKFGVRVDEFGFGLPPRLIGWHKSGGRWKLLRGGDVAHDTIYSLNWIPFGGFVKLYGEDGEFAVHPDSFSAQGKLPRAIILTAGVAMNVLFTVVLLSIGFMAGTPSVIEEDISSRASLKEVQVQVVQVMRDSPANSSGIEVGDRVVTLNSNPISSIREFQDRVQTFEGSEFFMKVEKEDGEVLEVAVHAEMLPEGEGRAIIGVGLIRTGIVSYPWYLAIFEGMRATGELGWHLLKSFGTILYHLVTTGRTEAAVAGPVGIAVLTGQVVHLGFIYILQFAATLSLNLAIINYFPFPALDGGRVLFILIEAIRRKAVSQKLESAMHTAGFALLITLIVFITYKDIMRYGTKIYETMMRAISG